MRTLEELTRPNVWRLKPYSSARDEYNGAAARKSVQYAAQSLSGSDATGAKERTV